MLMHLGDTNSTFFFFFFHVIWSMLLTHKSLKRQIYPRALEHLGGKKHTEEMLAKAQGYCFQPPGVGHHFWGTTRAPELAQSSSHHQSLHWGHRHWTQMDASGWNFGADWFQEFIDTACRKEKRACFISNDIYIMLLHSSLHTKGCWVHLSTCNYGKVPDKRTDFHEWGVNQNLMIWKRN